MKKVVALSFAIALAASARAYTQYQSTMLGIGTTGTNITYSCAIGGWSLGAANNAYCSSLVGITSGYASTNLFGCAGLGYGVFDGAYGLTDCIALGKNVGKNWRNRTGWVQIGDAFAYTNGYLNIKAPHGGQIGALTIGEEGSDTLLNSNLSLGNGGEGGNFYTPGNAYVGTVTAAGYVQSGDLICGSLRLVSSTSSGDCTLRFENGSLCLYTNEVKAGTITYTPVPAQQ